VDGAIFFMTPDDKTWYRGAEQRSARDNLIFEAGLFMAIHGRKRVALVVPSVASGQSGEDWKARLPSDLGGLTYAGISIGSGQDLAETALPEVLGEVAKMIVAGPQQPSEYGAAMVDSRLKRLLEAGRVELAHAIVAPWSEITDHGIGARMRDSSTRKIDILVSYRVNEVVRDMRFFRANPEARMRVCLSNMFDAELNAAYRRKYENRSEKELQDRLADSVRNILIDSGDPKEAGTIRAVDGKLNISSLSHPPAANYQIYLTPQRITYGYYRIDDIAWIVPLDLKSSKDPSPFAWAFDRERSTRLFDYYANDEFENVIAQAQRISQRVDLRTADLCFIDIEATGTVFGYHEIIDIGVIRTPPGADRIVSKWRRRIRPLYPERVTPKAAEVNGYNAADWDGAENPSKELWREFNEVVRDCVPVCHNPSFERAFIHLAARACGVDELSMNYHWIGTESLAWPIYVDGLLEELSLSGLTRFFDLPAEPQPHRAMGGALACWMVYRKLIELSGRTRGTVSAAAGRSGEE
jgi:DNA polymerase III epsilon subunit-like protein